MSLFEFPIKFLGVLSGIADCDFFFSSLVAGVCPLNPEVIPAGANGQLDLEEGFVLLGSLGEGLQCTMALARYRNQRGECHLSDW
jgi:hypothetical protein